MRARGRPPGADETLLLEFLHQHLEPFAFAPEQVLRRHPAVLEKEFAGVLTAQTQLVELAPAHEARRAAPDQDKTYSAMRRFRLRIGLDHHDKQVADLAV